MKLQTDYGGLSLFEMIVVICFCILASSILIIFPVLAFFDECNQISKLKHTRTVDICNAIYNNDQVISCDTATKNYLKVICVTPETKALRIVEIK